MREKAKERERESEANDEDVLSEYVVCHVDDVLDRMMRHSDALHTSSHNNGAERRRKIEKTESEREKSQVPLGEESL